MAHNFTTNEHTLSLYHFNSSPSDFQLSAALQRNLSGRKHKDDGYMARVVTRWLITHNKDFNQQQAEKLDSRGINEEK
jgi:hypothetical protein